MTFAASALLALPAGAASLNFILDQSNSLPDGPDYLGVEVADGDSGSIDFSVTSLEFLTDSARRDFGVKLFAFNVGDGSTATADDVTGLPDGWRAFDNMRADGFGRFDIVLMGPGWSRQSELTFSITGIDGDTPDDYAEESSGRARQGNTVFAAQAKGFKMRLPRPGRGPQYDDWEDDSWEMEAFKDVTDSIIAKWGNSPALDWLTPEDCWHAGTLVTMVKFLKLKEELLEYMYHPNHNRFVRSAFFGGSTIIPIPAAAGLLASALASLAMLRRRKPSLTSS